MKRRIAFPSDELSELETKYIVLWRQKRAYAPKPYLSVGDVLELLFATTRTIEVDGSDGRFFNFCLHNEESVIAWDGSEPIDIWLDQVRKNIGYLLFSGRTFNDIIDKP